MITALVVLATAGVVAVALSAVRAVDVENRRRDSEMALEQARKPILKLNAHYVPPPDGSDADLARFLAAEDPVWNTPNNGGDPPYAVQADPEVAEAQLEAERERAEAARRELEKFQQEVKSQETAAKRKRRRRASSRKTDENPLEEPAPDYDYTEDHAYVGDHYNDW